MCLTKKDNNNKKREERDKKKNKKKHTQKAEFLVVGKSARVEL